MLTAADFFDLTGFEHESLFGPDQWVWQALADLDSYLDAHLESRLEERRPSIRASIDAEVSPAANLIGEGIIIGKGTVVEAGACIIGPTVIGKDCEIRHGAYIRGQTLLGDRCVVGHASEVKHSILLDDAKAPHFAYVGDSILGIDVNLGAGTKLSNLAVSSEKSKETGVRPTIRIDVDGTLVDTGMAKLGAIIGDGSQLGCNSVTNPGCLIGRSTLIYANVSVPKGYVPDNRVVKLRQKLAITQRRLF